MDYKLIVELKKIEKRTNEGTFFTEFTEKIHVCNLYVNLLKSCKNNRAYLKSKIKETAKSLRPFVFRVEGW